MFLLDCSGTTAWKKCLLSKKGLLLCCEWGGDISNVISTNETVGGGDISNVISTNETVGGGDISNVISTNETVGGGDISNVISTNTHIMSE